MDSKESSQQVESKKNENWVTKTLDFMYKNVVWIALGIAILAYIGLAFPAYSTKLQGSDDRIGVYAASILGAQGYAFDPWILISWILPVVGVVLGCFHRKNKQFTSAAMMVLLLAGVMLIIGKDFFNNSSASIIKTEKTEYAFGGIFPAVCCFMGSLLCLIGGYENDSYSTMDLVESGMLVGLAVVLNFIKLPIQVEGSVNFQMLPLFILALRKGPLKGFIGAGIVFGIITCFTDGYGLYLYPFDYLVAFGACAIMGFFKPLILGKDQTGYNIKGEIWILVGGILSTAMRFVGHCVSSIVFFGLDVPGALIYNAAYVFISGGIALAVLMAMYGPLVKVNLYFNDRAIKRIN
jgi:thiamine transporter